MVTEHVDGAPRGKHPRAALRDVVARARAAGARGSEVEVLRAVWSFADPAGGAWPSQQTIAAQTGRAERTVRSALQRLERRGLIVRAVPTHGARRWGWVDPSTGQRRGARRSTVYVVAADLARRQRERPAPGLEPDPSPEVMRATRRVERALERQRIRERAAATTPPEWSQPTPREIGPRWASAAELLRAARGGQIDRQPLPPKTPGNTENKALFGSARAYAREAGDVPAEGQKLAPPAPLRGERTERTVRALGERLLALGRDRRRRGDDDDDGNSSPPPAPLAGGA